LKQFLSTNTNLLQVYKNFPKNNTLYNSLHTNQATTKHTKQTFPACSGSHVIWSRGLDRK